MSTVHTHRLTGVVNDALAAIHEVLERHQVTEAEWHAALAFLTEVGRADEFILLSDGSMSPTRGWATPTSCSCEGP